MDKANDYSQFRPQAARILPSLGIFFVALGLVVILVSVGPGQSGITFADAGPTECNDPNSAPPDGGTDNVNATSATYSAGDTIDSGVIPAGAIFTGVCIKTGNNFPETEISHSDLIDENTNGTPLFSCFEISGIGGSSITVTILDLDVCSGLSLSHLDLFWEVGTPTSTATNTATATNTGTATSTSTATQTGTATNTPTGPTNTPTNTPEVVETPLTVITPTDTPPPGASPTASPTATSGVAGVVVTPTVVAGVAGVSVLPPTGTGPGKGDNHAFLIGGVILIVAGGVLFIAGRRARQA
jgi:hypothetical protein